MKAVTLWRPWDHAILYGGKRIENRPWKPWPSIIGKRIALHSGRKYDTEGAQWMLSQGLYTPPPPSECIAGAIVGTATVSGFVTDSDSSWFFGPYGWVLMDVKALPEPILCRGAQGLWNLPKQVELQVLAQVGS